MLVKDFMTPNVITINEDQNILEAREALVSNNITSLPVVDDLKRVRGLITMGDITKASPSEGTTLSRYETNYLLGRLKVKDIMIRNVITVNEEDSIEYICYQVYKSNLKAFPVVDQNNKLCGIIAQIDMLHAFVEAFGLHRSCTRLTICLTDEPGVLASVCKIFQDANVNILSVLTSVNTATGSAEIIVRAELDNHMDVIEKLRQAGYNVTDIMTIRGIN